MNKRPTLNQLLQAKIQAASPNAAKAVTARNNARVLRVLEMVALHQDGCITDHELLVCCANIGGEAEEPKVGSIDPATGLRHR